MRIKISLNRQGFVNLITVIVGAALLVALIAYMGFLIGTKNRQSSGQQVPADQQPPITMEGSFPTPTSSPAIPTPTTGFDQTDLTEGWKTFISSIHGFEVRYPSDWNVFEYSQQDSGPDISGEYRTAKFRNFTYGSLSLESGASDIEILISYYNSNLPLKDWFNDYKDRWLLNPDDEIRTEWLALNGRFTLHLSRSNSRLAPKHIQETFFLEHPPGIWRVTGSGSRDRAKEIEEIVILMMRNLYFMDKLP